MIIIKSEREIALMREAGHRLDEVFHELEKIIAPGISTLELSRVAEKLIKSKGCLPSFKGYCGFPAAMCTSVNNVLIHGIPSSKMILKEGDIISLDLGTIYEGYQGDAARTYAVGKISPEAEKLISVTKNSFFEGIKFAKPGLHLSDISHAIQVYVESFGYTLPEDYTGHGIGTEMHEDPAIPNYGKEGRGPLLKVGMCLAIEPMVHVGSKETETLDDGWTVTTLDRKLSAHYENTIVITDDGCEILTSIGEERHG